MQVVLCTALISFAIYRISVKARHITETDESLMKLARNAPKGSKPWGFSEFLKGKLSNVTRSLVWSRASRGSGRLSAKPRAHAFANHTSMCDHEARRMGVSCRCDEPPDVPLKRVKGWGTPQWEKMHALNCKRAKEAKDVDVVWYGDSITGRPMTLMTHTSIRLPLPSRTAKHTHAHTHTPTLPDARTRQGVYPHRYLHARTRGDNEHLDAVRL